MYSPLQLASKYFKYWITASNSKGHGMHSPFVFEFITKILNDKKVYPEYEKVEGLRNQLLNDNTVLEVEDFGAGSVIDKKSKRSISSIAKNAAKPKKFGQLLFRMIKHYQPATILELGTSLGITTSYLLLAKPDGRLITMEGSKEISQVAKQNFQSLELKNIEFVEGNFDNTLSYVIRGLSTVDFAFIDGNHRKEPTETYFKELLAKTNNDSILVFDDIHWSSEMEAAWETIKKDAAVTCSIDLFFIGIVFFRKEFKEKQDFVIRF
ncbi:MAG TPA: class I SAM-dependent methyltransferase [Chitinophagaceae bacterium]|jgi:predicted O-methyltransferase YrrM|nr:class I SAM-dependent methyltransferase [Chitinophagaceae bacterium]